YKGVTIPLIGQSNEYICHISQPDRATEYCTLDNYISVLNTMQANKNNLLRLWAVLNNSPGIANPSRGNPYLNEQPFKWVNGKWDLNQKDTDYFTNLEKVVCEAYNRDIIVEVTLLDPWCNPWSSSPFNQANTVVPQTGVQLGFPASTGRRFFASFENTTTKTDPTYSATRDKQKEAVANTVLALKKYPNVIFEISNEPDFIPSEVSGVAVAHVMDWQAAMLAVVQTNDSSTSPHMIEINGHTATSFGWNVPAAKMASSHYTQIVSDSNLFGAIEEQRSSIASIAAGRPTRILSFNENRWASIKNVSTTDPFYRTADAVRSEAWEFMLNGGGAFDGYTLDRNGVESKKVLPQLGVLSTFLNPVFYNKIGLQKLDAMQQTSCNGTSDWCRGVPAWGNSDEGSCGGSGARILWSTLKSGTELALYVHHGVFQSDLAGGGKFDAYQARLCGNGTSTGYSLPVTGSSAFQYRVPQAGCWTERWLDPRTGLVLASTFRGNLAASNWMTPVTVRKFTHDILFFATYGCPMGL